MSDDDDASSRDEHTDAAEEGHRQALQFATTEELWHELASRYEGNGGCIVSAWQAINPNGQGLCGIAYSGTVAAALGLFKFGAQRAMMNMMPPPGFGGPPGAGV